MMKSAKMRDERTKAEHELIAEQRKEIERIIDKLYKHPIAMADKHYDFLKEIEKDLREFKQDYCY